jgi:two-component system, NtrC family, sensor kinase
MNSSESRPVLYVDDMPSIHEDFRKILCPAVDNIDLDAEEALLFGTQTAEASLRSEMDSHRLSKLPKT